MKMIYALFTAVCVLMLTSGALCAADGNPEDGKKSAAVVYFSPTGTTKSVAEKLAAAAGADIYEIVPKDKYSSADLNYRNDGCRANREMKDASARPAIANDLSAVAGHDVVFIGYPIWWGTAPRIINTFFEKCVLRGADIYLFCTSGGSGVGTSVSDLRAAYPSVNIKDAKRFSGGSASEIGSWAQGIVSKK